MNCRFWGCEARAMPVTNLCASHGAEIDDLTSKMVAACAIGAQMLAGGIQRSREARRLFHDFFQRGYLSYRSSPGRYLRRPSCAPPINGARGKSGALTPWVVIIAPQAPSRCLP